MGGSAGFCSQVERFSRLIEQIFEGIKRQRVTNRHRRSLWFRLDAHLSKNVSLQQLQKQKITLYKLNTFYAPKISRFGERVGRTIFEPWMAFPSFHIWWMKHFWSFEIKIQWFCHFLLCPTGFNSIFRIVWTANSTKIIQNTHIL